MKEKQLNLTALQEKSLKNIRNLIHFEFTYNTNLY